MNPYIISDVELAQVCKYCYDRIIKELNGNIVSLIRTRDNLQIVAGREKVLASKAGNLYYKDTKRQKIEDLTKLIKEIAMNQCRNDLCMKNLTKLPQDSKLYSVSTFKPYGKRHHTFYLCSLNCFKRMKAIFGIEVVKITHQRSLD